MGLLLNFKIEKKKYGWLSRCTDGNRDPYSWVDMLNANWNQKLKHNRLSGTWEKLHKCVLRVYYNWFTMTFHCVVSLNFHRKMLHTWARAMGLWEPGAPSRGRHFVMHLQQVRIKSLKTKMGVGAAIVHLLNMPTSHIGEARTESCLHLLIQLPCTWGSSRRLLR